MAGRGPVATSALRWAAAALLAIGPCRPAAAEDRPAPDRSAPPGVTAQPLRAADASGFAWLDVTRSFPDWAGEVVLLDAVFEGDHGGLVVRVGVSREGVEPPSIASWDVDLRTGARSRSVPVPGAAGLYGPPPGENYARIDGSIRLDLSPNDKVVVAARDPRGECRDPVNGYFALQHRGDGAGTHSPGGIWRTVASVILIVPAYSRSGYTIGGDCGDDQTAPRSVHTFAWSLGSALYGLRDRSSIVQIGDGPANGPTFWIRLKPDLSTAPMPSRVLAMDDPSYEALLQHKGLAGAQSHLLSILNR